MAVIKPFCAVRAPRSKAALVSTRSYEAYSDDELAAQLNFNPFTFLHIINQSYKRNKKISDKERLQLIRDKYIEFKELGYFSKDSSPAYYVYKKAIGERSSCGIIAITSVQDYVDNIIKKHEATLEKREKLFSNYLKTVGFNAEPVLLTFPDNDTIASILKKYQSRRAEYEFTAENRKDHTFWIVDDKNDIALIQNEFAGMEAIYIADGHHRCASSFLLSEDLKNENPNHTGDENYNFFMSYLIPESDLQIFEFNRLVKDLNGLTKLEFLEKLSTLYRIQNRGAQPYKPSKKHHFSMYLHGEFYSLYLKKEKFEIDNPLSDLDPQLLYTTILKPILGIENLRKDKRLKCVHSKQSVEHLKSSVDSGKYAVAFGMVPVSLEQLKAVADAGLTMPPKSTYIFPKLRSGLTIYEF